MKNTLCSLSSKNETEQMETLKKQRPVLSPLLLFTAFLLHLNAAAVVTAQEPSPQPTSIDYIRSSCGATLYPEICYSSLFPYASAVQENPRRLARIAIGVSLYRAHRMSALLSNLSRDADYGSDHRVSSALHDCLSNFGDAVDEIRGSLKQMRQLGAAGSSAESFKFQMSNVQTWMSAALTDEETCTDGLEDVPDAAVKTEVCDRAADVKKFTSNALALVNSYAAKGTF